MKKVNKNLGMPIITDKELLKTYAKQIKELRDENKCLKDEVKDLRIENSELSSKLDRAYESIDFYKGKDDI
jgi:predicted RNase H-like nuclease (RuvC/YqgF family)